MWKQLSDDLKQGAQRAGAGLAHVGGSGIPGRTALLWADGLAVTLARQAEDGETVPVVLGGTEVNATVKAWDSRTGLALLAVPNAKFSGWSISPVPAVGTLVLTVAYPSPQGVEARLDLVRFSGGASDWGRGVTLQALLQTDGTGFPGFTGAAVVDADGALVGLVAENRSGNDGFVVPAADLERLVDKLIASGSPKRPWLGVSTRPGAGQGLVVLGVEPGSPADRAGWKAGDLLVSLGGTALKDPGDFMRSVAALVPGTESVARLVRDGEVVDRPITPEGR